MLSNLLTLCRGFAMGSADVVPGVSGGTVAYLLGIYPRLLSAINSITPTAVGLFFRGRWRHLWRQVDAGFLILLAAGIVSAVLFFTRVIPIPVLLQTHPQQVYGLFFGLIVGSLIVLVRELGRHNLVDLAWMLAGTGLGLALVNMVPMNLPHTATYVFISGAVAITAMLLPGISGSFILLILHQYAHVMNAISTFRLSVVAPFLAGCLVGLLLFSRVLRWLLNRFPRRAPIVINGLLIGSLWAVWPFQQRQFITVREKARLISSQPVWPDQLGQPELMALGLIIAGVLFVVALGYLARSKATA
ncbi:MAG: DUF368 domain-containing protein [Gammaproteobacteria bacterium]